MKMAHHQRLWMAFVKTLIGVMTGRPQESAQSKWKSTTCYGDEL